MSDIGDTAHASCVLVGRSAILIRGASGSGKSRLALALIEPGRSGWLPPAWLVADDRVHLIAAHGRLLARSPDAVRYLMEVRGLGIRKVKSEPFALVSLVVDLGAEDAARLPEAAALRTEILGVDLPRLPAASVEAALSAVAVHFSMLTQG